MIILGLNAFHTDSSAVAGINRFPALTRTRSRDRRSLTPAKPLLILPSLEHQITSGGSSFSTFGSGRLPDSFSRRYSLYV